MDISKEQLMYLHEQIHYYNRQAMSQREQVQELSKNLTDYDPRFKSTLRDLNEAIKKLSGYYIIFLQLEKFKNSLNKGGDPKSTDKIVVGALRSSFHLDNSFARERLSEVIQQMIEEDFHLEYEFK